MSSRPEPPTFEELKTAHRTLDQLSRHIFPQREHWHIAGGTLIWDALIEGKRNLEAAMRAIYGDDKTLDWLDSEG